MCIVAISASPHVSIAPSASANVSMKAGKEWNDAILLCLDTTVQGPGTRTPQAVYELQVSKWRLCLGETRCLLQVAISGDWEKKETGLYMA